jgi:PhzF family phenazine biosynthesis protein
MREIIVKCVDTFTSRSFAGNPAGIVDNAADLDDETMQRLAGEMMLNIVEYGFLMPSAAKGAVRRVRYFTPQREIDISGHVTIAACHSLIEDGAVALEEGITKIAFDTATGSVPIEIHARGSAGGMAVEKIMMNQAPHTFRYAEIPVGEIAPVLGIPSREIAATGLPMVIASQALDWLIIPVKNKETILEMHPDLIKLAQLNKRYGVLTNHVFTLDTFDPNAVAYARHFGPVIGIWEDPATAVAAGVLGTYLLKYGVTTAGSMLMQQGRESDSLAEVLVEIDHRDGAVTALRVGGRATTSIAQTVRIEKGELVIG